MKFLNIYYLIVILAGFGLWKMNTAIKDSVALFYGFAENKETEINLNFSVEVNKIHVTTGQFVKEGTVLLEVSRVQIEEDIQKQEARIAELRADEGVRSSKIQGEIQLLEARKTAKLDEIDADIKRLEEEKKYKTSLFDGLESVEAPKNDKKYDPIALKIGELENEKKLVTMTYDTQIENLQQTLKIGSSPTQQQIRRLETEKGFEENKKKRLIIKAPSDGLIGNIHCKEAEFFPDFKTLITFYEPNPTLIKGYVHEDLIVHVAVQDSFLVESVKSPELRSKGQVVGLGSRIVEIPERLRKIKEMKTYGREVLIEIPADNQFLQKEKVVLRFQKKI